MKYFWYPRNIVTPTLPIQNIFLYPSARSSQFKGVENLSSTQLPPNSQSKKMMIGDSDLSLRDCLSACGPAMDPGCAHVVHPKRAGMGSSRSLRT